MAYLSFSGSRFAGSAIRLPHLSAGGGTTPVDPPVTPGAFSTTFRLEGTGAPAGTVVTFGQAFEQGQLAPGQELVATRADGTTKMATQYDQKDTPWPDGSVRFAAVHVAVPALSNGAFETCTLATGTGPTGANLNMAALLAGRTATVEIKNGSNVSTFDLIALLPAGRWFNGKNAVSARVIADIPRASLGGTSDARLYADLVVTADGVLDVDVGVWNYFAFRANQGTARYDIKLTGDAGVQYVQTGVVQPLYTCWGPWLRYKTTGLAVDRPWVKNNNYPFAKAGFTPNFDQQSTVDSAYTDTYATSMARSTWNTPFTTAERRDLMEYFGDPGDATGIGEVSESNAVWLVSGHPTAQKYAMGQAEMIGQIPMHAWYLQRETWVNPIDLPWRRTHWADNQYTGAEYPGYNGVGNFSNDIDDGHFPAINFVPYIMTCRRKLLDFLNGTLAKFVSMRELSNQRGDFTASNDDTDAARTARLQAARTYPGAGIWITKGTQTRAMAWTLRQALDCMMVTPASEQPFGDYCLMVARAGFWYWHQDIPALTTIEGEIQGVFRGSVYGGNNGTIAPWQWDMAASQMIRGVRAKVDKALEVMTWHEQWAVGKFLNASNGFNPADGVAYNLRYFTDITNTVAYKPWATLQTQVSNDGMPYTEQTGYSFGLNFANVTGPNLGNDYPVRARALNYEIIDLWKDLGQATLLSRAKSAKGIIDQWPASKLWMLDATQFGQSKSASGWGVKFAIVPFGTTRSGGQAPVVT